MCTCVCNIVLPACTCVSGVCVSECIPCTCMCSCMSICMHVHKHVCLCSSDMHEHVGVCMCGIPDRNQRAPLSCHQPDHGGREKAATFPQPLHTHLLLLTVLLLGSVHPWVHGGTLRGKWVAQETRRCRPPLLLPAFLPIKRTQGLEGEGLGRSSGHWTQQGQHARPLRGEGRSAGRSASLETSRFCCG